MQKAAEDLKQQQLLKEQERQKVLGQRIVPLPDVEGINNQSKSQKFFFHYVFNYLQYCTFSAKFLQCKKITLQNSTHN